MMNASVLMSPSGTANTIALSLDRPWLSDSRMTAFISVVIAGSVRRIPLSFES